MHETVVKNDGLILRPASALKANLKPTSFRHNER